MVVVLCCLHSQCLAKTILLVHCKSYHMEVVGIQKIRAKCLVRRVGRYFMPPIYFQMVELTMYETKFVLFTVSITVLTCDRSRNLNRRQKLICSLCVRLSFVSRVDFHIVVLSVDKMKSLFVYHQHYLMKVNVKQKIPSERNNSVRDKRSLF